MDSEFYVTGWELSAGSSLLATWLGSLLENTQFWIKVPDLLCGVLCITPASCFLSEHVVKVWGQKCCFLTRRLELQEALWPLLG